jgi:hypothetical protein
MSQTHKRHKGPHQTKSGDNDNDSGSNDIDGYGIPSYQTLLQNASKQLPWQSAVILV